MDVVCSWLTVCSELPHPYGWGLTERLSNKIDLIIYINYLITINEFFTGSGFLKNIVISMGGSVLFNENFEPERIKKFASMIAGLKKDGFEVGVVVGGGKMCGKYVDAARGLGANEFFCDDLGMKVTRVNAFLFIQALGDIASPQVVTDYFEAKKIMGSGKVTVMGGMLPSITTDAVAALLAEFVESDLVNVTNVRGVYSDDPTKNSDAEFHKQMSFEEMVLLSSEKDSRRARSNFVFDAIASKIIARSKVRTSIVGSDSVENILKAVKRKGFDGTLIG